MGQGVGIRTLVGTAVVAGLVTLLIALLITMIRRGMITLPWRRRGYGARLRRVDNVDELPRDEWETFEL